MARLSALASGLQAETAFTVLAIARRLKARGKDVVELEIGDSPFPSTPHAKAAGIRAIEEDQTGYCPSLGLPEFREAAARAVRAEFGLPASTENVVVASGAKPFEQYFAEALIDPGDGVLIFSPHFPTYVPNLQRRGARAVLAPLAAEHGFRPRADDVRRFLETDPRPRGVFLNSPHNPTGGVATRDDLAAIADVVRGTDLVVFSDEPYCHMVWGGRHESILAQPGMLENAVAAYTFSKSYSMSGWRLGFAVSSPAIIDVLGKLTNSALSCVPPFTQMAGIAALRDELGYRDAKMKQFQKKVELLVAGMNKIDGVSCVMPGGTFYVFPSVAGVCNRLGITSHGLALYLLEGADDARGVACLGGECFGDAGRGFLRLSCAQPDERIAEAFGFMADAFTRKARVDAYLNAHPEFRLIDRYEEPAVAHS
jgi:aspartate aminotransferase